MCIQKNYFLTTGKTFICLRIFATLIQLFFIFRMPSQISRRKFFDVWFANATEIRQDALLHHIMQELGNPSFSDHVIRSLKVTIRSFCQKIEEKWLKSGRHRDRFLNKNCAWLEGNVTLPDIATEVLVSVPLPETSSGSFGRPQKDFVSSSTKTKRRRIQHLLETSSREEISMATEVQLRKEGKKDSAAIVKELCLFSPRRGTVLKKARKYLESSKPVGLSPDQALALMVDANLSTHQYRTIREQVKGINKKIYPPYYTVKAAKQLCYPSGINVTETYAEIELQSLMDHTIIRLCKVQEDVLKTISNLKSLDIIVKWGCDGAEQSKYKQKFSEEHCSDENLFSISIVPIQMNSINEQGIKDIVWQNPSPASPRYCRPIKFVFAKETVSVITMEVNKIKEQITSLSPVKIIVNDKEVLVEPTLIFCMIDGKICNAVSSYASTQTCYLCGAKPREMNNESLIVEKPVNSNLLSLGLSPLHSWIRFFECILHISYRLDIKLWQARGAENKKKVAEKKKQVQKKFRSELGLLVDMPKQQTGTTNDGNTARKFFRNPEKSAEITGVNVELIKRLHVILECINSGFHINVNKFHEFAKQTRDLYIKEYSWYPMPVSVHKILFHGKEIIASCILPIGQLSEEAQEARNKHNKKFREMFTRKTSRLDTNTDLLNRLLITSDPYIASLRAAPKTRHGKMTPEVCELLEMRTPDIENEGIQSELSDSEKSYTRSDLEESDCSD